MKVLLFLCVMAVSTVAQASCPVMSPELTFKVDVKPVVYDHSLDKAQIRVKSNASGLVSGHLQGDVNVKLVPKTKRSADNRCILFTHADVIVTNTPVLRIASNYKKGTCEYGVIKTHEEKHLHLMQRFFKTLERDYRKYLEKEMSGKGSVLVSEKETLRSQLLSITKKFITKINREQSHLHLRDIDHPDKVADERAQCRNW